jgi:hypothetical protein
MGRSADAAAAGGRHAAAPTDRRETAVSAVLAIFTVEGEPQELKAAYDRAMPLIQAGADRYGAPQMHACAATDSGLTIVDVWDSADAFARFAEHPDFARARREAGLPDPATVQVWPVHAAGWPVPAAAP